MGRRRREGPGPQLLTALIRERQWARVDSLMTMLGEQRQDFPPARHQSLLNEAVHAGNIPLCVPAAPPCPHPTALSPHLDRWSRLSHACSRSDACIVSWPVPLLNAELDSAHGAACIQLASRAPGRLEHVCVSSCQRRLQRSAGLCLLSALRLRPRAFVPSLHHGGLSWRTGMRAVWWGDVGARAEGWRGRGARPGCGAGAAGRSACSAGPTTATRRTIGCATP